MTSSIEEWLKRLGLGKYARVFAEEEIDEDALSELTEADLDRLGLPLGPRKKLLKAISELPPNTGGTLAATSRAAASGGAPGAPDAGRRQLTIVFCDLVGSTELSQALDPEDLREVTRAYQDACKTALERFGGYVAKYMGDGVLAYFGYPHAHEDDSERAVRAGLAVVGAVRALGPIVHGQQIPNLAVRVGIATGLVVVGDLIGQGAAQENVVIGETPNLAARLQAVAQPNEVVVSSTTQSLVGSSLRFEPMGPRILKGFSTAMEAWRVTGLELGGGRFERAAQAGFGRFVGRAAELERICNAWSRVLSGERVILHVTGEPGIGKSRLIHEFRKQIQGAMTALEGHCMSHGGATPFLPFIEMLRRSFALSDRASSEQLVEEMSAAVAELGLSDELHLPYLLNLLGFATPNIAMMGWELIALRTREALTAVIRALGRRQPTLLYVNDCHWIDKSSETLLERLAHEETLGGVLTICTFRPEYDPPWSGFNPVRTVRLNPLSAAQVTILLGDRLGIDSVADRALDEFLEWCGGNPLFAEELAYHFFRQGRSDWATAASGSGRRDTSVPMTLVGLLLEHVDRLSQEARRMLQAASVMGRRFRSDIVADVARVQSPAGALQEAEREGLILPDTFVQASGYRFKHALVQDAVYGSLLTADRKALHGAIANRLEEVFRGRESGIAEELARHFTIADDVAKAARWAAAAGDKALALFAIEHAKSWYGQALELLSAGPEPDDNLFAGVLVNQLEVLCWEIDYPGMVALADRHLPRVEALGETRHMSRVFSWLGDAYLNSARFPQARNAVERALAIGESLKDLMCMGHATAQLMWWHAMIADSDGRANHDIEAESSRVLAIAEQLGDRYLKTVVHYAMALELAQRGYLDGANMWASRSVELGRATGYPPASAWGLCIRAYTEAWAESYDAAVLDSREAVRVAQSKYDRLMAKMTLGSALVLQGNTTEGRKILEEAKEARIGRSMIGFMFWPDMVYGLAVIGSGQLEQGMKILEETDQQFLGLGHRRAAGQVRLVIGEAYGQMALGRERFPHSVGRISYEVSSSPPDGADRARKSLKQALELARETGMDGVAARAFIGLATLAKAQRRDDQARDYLDHAREKARPLHWLALDRMIKQADEVVAPETWRA